MYPYFYIGVDINIKDAAELDKPFNEVCKVMTEKEAQEPVELTRLKSVLVIAGTQIEQGLILHQPIKLQEFVAAGGRVPPGCHLESCNLSIYINGKEAVRDEDYSVEKDKINILWDLILPEDTFSFRIPIHTRILDYNSCE